MKTLGTFEVVDLGIHHSDYFQGFGSEDYDNACVGIGDSEEAALDDCIEIMAQSDNIIFDDSTEERIRSEYGTVDDKIIIPDCAGCGEFDDCGNCETPYHHIGIRWNTRAADRYRRIRKIKNLEPLRYESWEHDADFVWYYARRADGSASYGDFKSTDWPNTAENYLNTLYDDITETNELYFYVPYASGSDYSGSTVERANAKCIEDDFGKNEWVHPVYGGHGTYAVAISLTGLLNCDDDTFDELCSILEGLVDYSCIDDEALSFLEMELSDEAWNNWVKADFENALEDKFKDYTFNWPDNLRSFFEEKREQTNVYWESEIGGTMHINIKRIVESIAFDDIEDYAVQYEVSWNDGGEQVEIYYDENKARNRVNELRGFWLIAGASYRVIEPDHLKLEAMQSAKQRGHTMGEWVDEGENTSFALCMVCGKEVQIIRKQKLNEFAIGGPAVTIDCDSFVGASYDVIYNTFGSVQESFDNENEAKAKVAELRESGLREASYRNPPPKLVPFDKHE